MWLSWILSTCPSVLCLSGKIFEKVIGGLHSDGENIFFDFFNFHLQVLSSDFVVTLSLLPIEWALCDIQKNGCEGF